MQQARTLQIYGSPALSISYQQFFVYDSSEKLPGSLWSEQHFAQGFVRRPHAICFGTLLEYGLAAIAAYVGVPEDLSKYDRVIRVPLSVISGKINFEGPEEYPIVREVHLPPNTYRVYCAQTVTAVGYDVDLFFEEADISQDRSCILKADEIVDAKGALLETGEVAQ